MATEVYTKPLKMAATSRKNFESELAKKFGLSVGTHYKVVSNGRYCKFILNESQANLRAKVQRVFEQFFWDELSRLVSAFDDAKKAKANLAEALAESEKLGSLVGSLAEDLSRKHKELESVREQYLQAKNAVHNLELESVRKEALKELLEKDVQKKWPGKTAKKISEHILKALG